MARHPTTIKKAYARMLLEESKQLGYQSVRAAERALEAARSHKDMVDRLIAALEDLGTKQTKGE